MTTRLTFRKKKERGYSKLFLCLMLPQLVAMLGAYFSTSSDGSWYDSLEKPFFNPPSTIFGPIWTVLYVLMGIASYIVWMQKSPWYSRTMTWYWIHLVLNALWTPVFFGLQSPLKGLFIITPMWVLVGICVLAFSLRSRIASFMMVPYFLWVSYEMVLNASIYWLNRSV